MNFKALHLYGKVLLLVLALHTFEAQRKACLWLCSFFMFMFVSCSDNGQPPFDQPGVTDSQWYLSLQHSAGWELHPAFTWRLQLYWLAPHTGCSLCVHSCQHMCVKKTLTVCKDQQHATEKNYSKYPSTAVVIWSHHLVAEVIVFGVALLRSHPLTHLTQMRAVLSCQS